MAQEGQDWDKKSLRVFSHGDSGIVELAKDCVAFANASGGRILIGIEDDKDEPSPSQKIDPRHVDRLSKRIPQLTQNVGVSVRKVVAGNGGEYIELQVFPSTRTIAATSNGYYFIRVADECRRVMPDEMIRLASDKDAFVWEAHTPTKVPYTRFDGDKRSAFLDAIRASDRVSNFVRQKSDDEILKYYFMVRDDFLTNMGVLWIGQRNDRALLRYAPVVQCIKFDEQGRKTNKWVWNDYELNPQELIEAVWREIPEWRENYELPDGMFRTNVPHYDEVVLRELLANALAHRPYTMRGDVFLNLYPDRLEVHNPGLLPLGVTPRNILHTSVKRNAHLAKVFYDLRLMEGEGSGYDRMYEVLLTSGRPVPEVKEGDDRVVVTVQKRIINPEIIAFIHKADESFQLTQRERITLGLIAQHEAMKASDLCRALNLSGAEELNPWFGQLLRRQLIRTRGRTRGTEYMVDPAVLRELQFKGVTTLRRIEAHRLKELLLQDLAIYGEVKIAEMHLRIGREIPRQKIRRALKGLIEEGTVEPIGDKRGRRYVMISKAGRSHSERQT